MAAQLQVGERVAWSHHFAIYSADTVLVQDAHMEAPRGVVTALVEENASVLEVTFDDDTVRALTSEELVRIEAAA
jgi:hypothetical protein